MSRLQVRANTRDVRIFRTRKPDVNRIIAVDPATKRERVLWERPQPESVRPANTQPKEGPTGARQKPVDSKGYDQRVIVQLESGATGEEDAERIFEKHPDDSVLIKRGA